MLIPHTIKITGTNAAVSITAGIPASAKQVDLKADSGNSGTILFGGADVSSTVGAPLAAGEFYDFGPVSLSQPALPDSNRWSLPDIYAYIPTGDILHVVYGG